jgi:HEAT repeat protein
MSLAGSGDASTALDALIAALEAATTDDQRRTCLQALGNAGDTRALAPIEQYLGNGNVSVRAAAVFALRFMTGDSVSGDLESALSDPDATVRRAAAAAQGFRSTP